LKNFDVNVLHAHHAGKLALRRHQIVFVSLLHKTFLFVCFVYFIDWCGRADQRDAFSSFSSRKQESVRFFGSFYCRLGGSDIG